ncbi:autotransporter domain-containing protein [Sphingomicrobium nitratireducens]|uniref:autotransporter domain-containing protein n=1 Tax=Sphingomicrobium nitratireducens TaxID=2964666 RepID=UPI00224009A2|nr:autotransporter domain-containing protein [Sphingomicrobium nitratireducens]
MYKYHSCRGRRGLYATLAATTALPLLVGATPASAGYFLSQAGSIVYQTEALEGAPAALSLISTGGYVDADVTTITSTFEPGEYGEVVYLETDAGLIDGMFGSISASGEGYVTGLYANSNSGPISVLVDTMYLDGEQAFGMLGISSGDVTLIANELTIAATGTDYDGTGRTSDGMAAISTGGFATASIGTGQVYGYNSTLLSAIGQTGADVSVTVAEGFGDDGTLIYGQSDAGDVSITATQATHWGSGNLIVAGIADAGSVTISAGEIVDGGSDNRGIYARAEDQIQVFVDQLAVNNYGVFATGADGDRPNILIDANSITSYGNVGIQAYGNDITIVSSDVEGGISGGTSGMYLDATGAVDIDVAGQVSATAYNGDAIGVNATDGLVTVDVNVAYASGTAGRAIIVETTSGDVVVNAGTTISEATGWNGSYTGDGILVLSDTGNVTVNSEYSVTNGLGGSAIAVVTSGDVTIDSGVSESTGTNGVNFYAEGHDISATVDSILMGTGVGRAAYVLASGAADVVIGDISAASSYGAFVQGGTSSDVTINGTVETYRYGAYAYSPTGTANVTVNGDITSAIRQGAIANGGTAATMTVSEGASVTSGTTGVALYSDGSSYLLNQGTISGGSEYAVYFGATSGTAGAATLRNEGTLIGGDLGAVFGTVSNDLVETTETSHIEGVVDLGDGTDTLRLVQSDGPAAVGEVAETVNVENLEVVSGSFRADGAASSYDNVTIADGAELIVAAEAGVASVYGLAVDVDGRYALDITGTAQASDFWSGTLTGDGTLALVGEGTLSLSNGFLIGNTGGVLVENGTFLITGAGANYSGTVETVAGGTFQLGEGGATGNFTGDLVNNGNFIFDRDGNYTFEGDFSGSGEFDKYGDGTLFFAGDYAYSGLTTIHAGGISLSGTLAETTELNLVGGTFDLSGVAGGAQTIASLSGTGGTLILGEIVLTLDQMIDTVFAGDITGTGTIVKDGEGTLNLTGDVSYAGDVEITGGTLAVNGTMTEADFFVETGGRLGGNGTVGDVVVDGGTLGAGNSIGHLVIAGDLTLDADSIFEIEVNAAGDADLVEVTGAAELGGATATILAEDGLYAPVTEYTVLTAEDGVTGEFGTVTTNFAFLDPTFDYGANAVTLTLTRNDIDFSEYGDTANQSIVGGLVEALGFGNALYDAALVLGQDKVAADFETLTGEAYPALASAMIETTDLLRRQLDAGAPEGDGVFVWGRGVLTNAKADARGNYRAVDLDGSGLAAGFGYHAGDLVVSLGGGRLWQDSDAFDLSDADMSFLDGRVDWSSESGFGVTAGALFGWSDGVVTRDTRLGTISATVVGDMDASVSAFHGEARYGFAMSQITLEPFVGLSHVSLSLDDLTETGGITALDVSDLDRDVTFGDAGLRVSAGSANGVSFDAMAGLRRAWGDRMGSASIAFADSPASASIGAMPIAKDALRLGAGLGYAKGRMKVSIGYDGTMSKGFDSHGVKAGLSIGF